MKTNELKRIKNAVISGILLLLFFGGWQTVLCGGDGCKNPTILHVDTIAGIPMVYVDGGSFIMGNGHTKHENMGENGQQAHSVALHDYYIGEYEVTQSEWVAVMDTNPSHFKGDNLPVENVSWFDAVEYIHKLNERTGKHFRLPTEAEWEFAAHGGNYTHNYKYSGSDEVDKVAWCSDDSDGCHHPVGTKMPNELNLYDMSGNVWEWCNDWYEPYRSGNQINPQGPSTGVYRVYCNGFWNEQADDMQITSRGFSTPDYHDGAIGFRLACDVL